MEEFLHIVQGRFRDVGKCFLGQECLMGSQQHVRHGYQKLQGCVVHDFPGAVLEKVVSLFLVYVQAYGTQLLVPQSLYQGYAVYQGTAGSTLLMYQIIV